MRRDMAGRESSAAIPYSDPPIRGLSVVQATLRIFVALECWGAAVSRLLSGHPSSLNRFLQQDFEVPTAVAGALDHSAAWCLLICGFVTLIRPVWPLLGMVSGWMLIQAISASVARYGVLPQLEPAQDAVRWVAPMVLAMIDFWPPPLKFSFARYQNALAILRVSIIATLLAYGAILIHHCRAASPLAEMLQAGLSRLRFRPLTTDQAQFALGIAGGVQIGLAIALLLSRSRPAAMLAAVIGILAAALPTIARGTAGYHETLIHLIDGGAPLALLIAWAMGFQEQPELPQAAIGSRPPGRH
jgi:hypothetical protein